MKAFSSGFSCETIATFLIYLKQPQLLTWYKYISLFQQDHLAKKGKKWLKRESAKSLISDKRKPGILKFLKSKETNSILCHTRTTNQFIKVMIKNLQNQYSSCKGLCRSTRVRRSKATSLSLLDKVPWIGKKRKKTLPIRLSSAKAVAEVGMIDLQKIEDISKIIAEKIYDLFHD